MKWLRSPLVIVAVAAAVFLPVMFKHLSFVDSAEHDRFTSGLRTLAETEARFNEDVLKSGAGLTESYDPMVADLELVDRTVADLGNAPSFLSGAEAASFHELLDRYADEDAAREVEADRFKAQNSILRNSLHYFPRASKDRIRDQAFDSQARGMLNTLLDDTLDYTVLPSAELLGNCRSDISQLERRAAMLPDADAQVIRTLLWHADTILKGKPNLDLLSRRLVTSPARGEVRDMAAFYEKAHERGRAIENAYRLEWYLTLLMLMAYYGWQLIVHFRRSARELAAARDLAEAADRAKADFLASMSHEIRTPLNGMIGMVDLLLETSLEAEQKDFARTARSSAHALLSVVNDILDFSKLEAGGMVIDPHACDLRDVVEDAADVFASRAAEKGIELVVRYSPLAPERVIADAGRLRQILLNLTSNAIKFTDSGSVTITVTPSDDGSTAPPSICLSVADTGIGIPADKLEHVFQRFTQADASTTRRFGGTGLGLAISKHLAELMGASLRVESVSNVGSTFSLRLPVVLDETPSDPPEPVSLSNLRVLVLDDRPATRQAVVDVLAAADADVTGAQTTPALDEIVSSFDMVVASPARVPRVLPGMLSNTRCDLRLLVLVESGMHFEPPADAVFTDVRTIATPVRKNRLLGAIAGWTEPARATETVDHTVQFARPGASALVVDDNKTNQTVARLRLEAMGFRVEIASNGREAIDAVARRRFDVVFMDCQMPVMDGYHATREIRSMEGEVNRTTIIAMTAGALDGDRERCLESGMDDYVSKPVSSAGLRKIVETWLPVSSTPAVASEEAPNSSDLYESIRAKCAELLEGVEQSSHAMLMGELIRSFQEDAAEGIARLGIATESGDADGIRRGAHALKGGSRELGARVLGDVCSDLEGRARGGDIAGSADALRAIETELERVHEVLRRLDRESNADLIAPSSMR